jgi:hypothetical protein
MDTSLMRDVNKLCVVVDPIHVLKFLARESGDPAIDHEINYSFMVRVENPIGVQQR